jgi:tetratricopeptide (TPR) repeat protein
MYLFVDATGEYLVVEGDSLILGNEEVFSLSNFYPSQVPNSADVRIPFYQNGKGYIDSAAVDLSFSSCSNVMNNFHQDFTQYTCVYDLDERVVNLYHFHDYDSHVTFRLAEELAKGDHEYFIPELFSKDSEGYQYYYDFNYDAEAMTQRINDKWLAAQNKFDQPTLDRIAVEVESMVNTIGYKWLRKGELDGAITLFVFNTELFPLASNTFDSLGEAYMHTEEYDLSIANYKKAIKLNKTNKAAKKASKKMLKKVKKLKRSSN